ncbi:MAG: AMP-binding protein, partial [Symploca sp. SIO2D2]|nr:AMP-binding protein [Symploca sp. SIO2D2]
LLNHHDALRLRYRKVNGVWQQYYADPDHEIPFQIETLEESDFSKALNERVRYWQANLDLEQGPLTRLVLFQHQENVRLLWVIHHLAVDAVSWRILLEDLNRAYTQAHLGEVLQLPSKTSSFQAWSKGLQQWSSHPDCAAEQIYWQQLPFLPDQLPIDFPQGSNQVINTCDHTLTLDSATTHQLLEATPSAYRTEINDLLLSALLLTLQEWSDQHQHLIDLESHGRAHLFDNIELSRTVGWFTALYTVVLSLPDRDDLGHVIKTIKEQLRQIPHDGIGYGLLRQQGEKLPQGQVLFNYLGQFDQTTAEPQESFRLAQERVNHSHSATGSRDYLIDINSLIIQQQLHLTFSYSTCQYQPETIESLANTYQKHLQNLIEHCQNHYGYTPSDFPLVVLSQQQLDILTNIYHNNIAAIYPLTPMQQGMLFHKFYEPDSRLYTVQLQCQLRGDIDPAALRQAWQFLVDRHPILRTAFRYDQNNPVQIVLKQVELPWLETDWLQFSEEEGQQKELQLQPLCQPSFDFAQAPLLSLQLIRTGSDRYQLIWHHHHILMDGWCLPILLRELFTVYHSLCHQQTPQLPPINSYQNYIAWLTQQDQQAAQSYWQTKLAGFSIPTPIPIARPKQQVAHHQEITYTLTPEETLSLNRFARQQRVTLNTLIQAAWAILLGRYSGETDIVFGAVTSGRNVPLQGIENIVGLFINTLPLRVDLNTDLSTLLQDLQTQQQENDRYAYTRLADIQSWSEVPNGVSLFDTIFVFENYPVDDTLRNPQKLPFQLEDIEVKVQTNYLFTLVVLPSPTLSLRLGFDRNRLEPEVSETIVEQLGWLLQQIITQPEASSADYTLLTSQAATYLPDPSQALPIPNYPLVTTCFLDQVDRCPDAIALRHGQSEWSYHTLYQAACGIAQTLLEAGLQGGNVVACCGERSPEMVATMMGIFLSGGICLSVDARLPLERRWVMLQTANARYGIAVDNDPGWMQEHCQIVIPQKGLSEVSLPPLQPQQPAYIFFTSGTTGTPKAIMGNHQGLAHYIHWHVDRVEARPSDSFAHFAALSFDAVLRDVWVPLTSGGTLVIPQNDTMLSGLKLFEWLDEEQISLWHTVPSLLHGWLTELAAPISLPHLRYLSLAGEPLREELVNLWRSQIDSPAQLLNLYGLTETTVIKSFYPVTDPQPGIQPLGQALPETQLLVLNRQQRCGLYEPGEIVIRTPFRTLGYLNMESTTFAPNPFRNDPDDLLYYTGDIGYYDLNGVLHSQGRRDSQVKVRGVRIELAEISSLLNQHPDVRRSVVAVQGEESHRYLVAFVVYNPDTIPREVELRRYLLDKLPDYMMPSRFIPLDTLPLTVNGKIDRKALPELNMLMEAELVPPRDAIERQLTQIWQDILKVSPLGVRDNFFELGGHSLLALRLMAEIEQQFQQHLPLTALFQGATIENLASLLRQKSNFQSWAPLVAIQPNGSKTPFFCVPGAGGEVTYLYHLAHHLGQDQPFYGLQAVGLDGKTKPYAQVEDMAARYIKEIQKVHPQGPYQLGGHSFGGQVALEMALQLTSQGHKVTHLIMLDAVAPFTIKDPNMIEGLWQAEVAGMIEYLLDIPFAETHNLLKTLESDALFSYLQEGLIQAHWLPSEASISQIRGMVEVLKANSQKSYLPKNSISTPITLFQALERSSDAEEMLRELQLLDFYQEPMYGWHRFATDIDVHPVSGTHISILTPPHVKLLAEKLKRCLV